MSRAALVLVTVLVALAERASAQEPVRSSALAEWPCTGGIGSVGPGAFVACHGQFEGGVFTGGPNDAVAHVGDVWVGIIDEENDATGLAVFRVAGDGVNWTRGIHVPTGTVIGTAVSGDGARIATVELHPHGARAEAMLVERTLPSLTRLRQVRLLPTTQAQSADVRYVAGAIAVAIGGRVVVFSPRGPLRTLLDLAHGVAGLSPSGTQAVGATSVPGDALGLHIVDVVTGVARPPFEIQGGGATAITTDDRSETIALLDDDGVRVIRSGTHAVTVVTRRDDAMSTLSYSSAADLVAWSGPTATTDAVLRIYDVRLLQRAGPPSSAARPPASARAPGVDVSALGAFAVRTAGRAETPLRAVDAATRQVGATPLLSGATADDPPATLEVELRPARLFAPAAEGNAWARAVAAMLGPVHVEATHVVGDHVVEIDGWDDGCDPPAAWVRVERRGEWLVRTELSVYGGDDAARARADGWKEALRHALR